MEIKIMEKLRKSMDNDDDILKLLIDLSEEKQHNYLWNYNGKHILNL